MGYKKHSEAEERQLVQEYISGVPVNALAKSMAIKLKNLF